MKKITHNYINGAFIAIDSEACLTLKNPTTEEPIAQIYLSTEAAMNEAIHAASNALILALVMAASAIIAVLMTPASMVVSPDR